MKFKNTLNRSSVRYIVFQDKEDHTWYAVALEFNIIESGDDPRVAFFNLLEAIHGYVNSARKVKARSYILNQKADPEYEKLWNNLQGTEKSRGIPYNIFTFGKQLLPV